MTILLLAFPLNVTKIKGENYIFMKMTRFRGIANKNPKLKKSNTCKLKKKTARKKAHK